jgi:hypothetical protein
MGGEIIFTTFLVVKVVSYWISFFPRAMTIPTLSIYKTLCI